MAFKNVMIKVRRAILCGRKQHKKKSCLEIGSPTDVRRLDVADNILGLSIHDKRTMDEKASNEAIRLLSLQSHPPNQPPSVYSTSFPHSPPPSTPPSREASQTLLNAASSNLPPTLPTPPRQKHGDTARPSHRMKTMWERTRRLSSSLSLGNRSSSGYQEFDMLNPRGGGTGTGAGTVTNHEQGKYLVDVDVKFNNEGGDVCATPPDSPISADGSEGGKSVDVEKGFEMKGAGGAGTEKLGCGENAVIERAVEDVGAVDSSDSEGETVVVELEKRRLV